MAFVDALVTTWRAGLFHHSLQSLLEAGLDERIKMTVEHLLRVGNFDARAQILDPRLIEHVRADLVAPLDVALGIFDRLLGAVATLHFRFIPRSEDGRVGPEGVRTCNSGW